LAVRKKKQVETGLEGKGFRKVHGDHFYYFYWTLAGKKTHIRTKTSHGKGKELDGNLLAAMARQTYLTSHQFLELVDCPMSQTEYERVLTTVSRLSG
jgi:hypothetical protein